jgi:hypothetical protein
MMETKPLWSDFSMLFEPEHWPWMEPKLNHGGTGNSAIDHRQLMNIQSLLLWHRA